MYHLWASLFPSTSHVHKQRHVVFDTQLTNIVNSLMLTRTYNIHLCAPEVTLISLLFSNDYQRLLFKYVRQIHYFLL